MGYRLENLHETIKKLKRNLQIEEKGIQELLSVLIMLKEGKMDLETAAKDIDTIYDLKPKAKLQVR